jgi:hypothetical protein
VYLPTLDGKFSADGVTYALRGETAVLISAEGVEGFFAVPSAVLYDGKEYSVTEIGNGAFARTALTGILIPEGVTKLSTGVFTGCEHLESVSLPATLMTIGRQTFSDCVSLGYISLPEKLTTIRYGTFMGCRSLGCITIPSGVTTIGESAFDGCNGLREVVLPETLVTIGHFAFRTCLNLDRLQLPKALTSIGDRAFASCLRLGDLLFPDSLTTIGEGAFYGCMSMQRLSLPVSVTHLGRNAFSGCRGLKFLYAPGVDVTLFYRQDAVIPAVMGYLCKLELYADPEIARGYLYYAAHNKERLVPLLLAEDLAEGIATYAAGGKITAENVHRDFLEPAIEAQATQCIAFLLEWSGNNGTASVDFRL